MLSRRRFLLLATVSPVILSGCQPGQTGPTAAQLQQVGADVARIAAVVAVDAPLLLHGGANTMVTAAADAVAAAAAQVAQSGANLTSVQGIADAITALLGAANADPSVPANIKADLVAAQVVITAAVAIWQIAGPVLTAAPAPMSVDEARAVLILRLRR